jgi:hypothetical protein
VTLHNPLFMQDTVTDAADILFTAQEMRMYHTAIGTLNGQGVYKDADFAAVQRAAGATFSVDVGAGICAVIGDDVTNQGIYYVWNDAVINVATPVAPGSGTRVHRLILQIRDKLHNGTYTTYDSQLQVLPDVGGGTPAEPASAVTLALISIAAGQLSVLNANIADKRQAWNDAWNSLNGLQSNGWSISGHDLPESGFRFRPGDPSMIEFMAFYSVGTTANGTLVTTLPSPYSAVGNFQRLPCGSQGGTTENNTPYLAIASNGQISCQSVDSTCTTLAVNGAFRAS